MCGRFARTSSKQRVAEEMKVQRFAVEDLAPRYNIAPSQPLDTIVSHHGERALGPMTWGLAVASQGRPPINVRSESAAVQPQTRDLFRSRRCLVVADGFYEWHQEGDARVPYYLHLRDGGPFAFAGLWTPSPKPEAPATCAILTCRPNEMVKRIHDRMPVILTPEGRDVWLDASRSIDELRAVLAPLPAEAMEAYEVSTYVNAARNDGPQCIEPV